MEKKFSGKIWKFGNDIDTDTIIPGKRGTIPDRNEQKERDGLKSPYRTLIRLFFMYKILL